MLDWIGWIATVVFATSYLAKEARKLRWIQAFAALLWISYGVAIHALPVIVANCIVAAAAVFSSFQVGRKRAKSYEETGA
ncbi:MAG TPA: hypothetical protein VGF06_05485 [Terriglobales bacterium]|jgi:uncharacterized protein with PQ loop repeat